MKIIKQGVLPGDELYKGICSYCGCVFEASGREVDKGTDVRNEPYIKCSCPCCHKDTYRVTKSN